MCLSTAYYKEQTDENIIARYVSEIQLETGNVILTDVMGCRMEIDGSLKYVDLTGGVVIIEPAE